MVRDPVEMPQRVVEVRYEQQSHRASVDDPAPAPGPTPKARAVEAIGALRRPTSACVRRSWRAPVTAVGSVLMSVPVSLEKLRAEVERFGPVAYLLTVSDDG